MNRSFINISVAILLALAAAWIALSRPVPAYPFMVMEVTDSLSITFLLKGQRDPKECESTVAGLASTMLGKCPGCRVRQLQCLDGLSAEQARQLSSAPLGIPSARMRNGVALYQSQDAVLAQAACEESERQSLKARNGGNILKCFAPDTPRVVGDAAALEADGSLARHVGIALFIFGAGVFVMLTAWRSRSMEPGSFQYIALQRLADLDRRTKQIVIAASDAVLILFSLWLAFALRLERFIVPRDEMLWLFLTAPLIAIPVFVRLGLYQAITRYIGMQAVTNVVKAVAIYVMLFALVRYLLDMTVPSSVLLAHGILALFFVAATRLVARDCFNRLQMRSQAASAERRNVLIYGAGSAGVQLASALEFSRELRPVAFIDDATALHKQSINGLRVHGPDELPDLLAQHAISEILLAMPSTQRSRRNEIMRLIETLPVSVRTLPGLDQLAGGTVKIEDLRELDIEDLLGRDPVPGDPELLRRNISGKAILVTGAGGSIGSELCRQIVNLQPRRLVLYERNEFGLYSVEQELLNLLQAMPDGDAPELIPILGCVTDQARLERVLRHFGIDTIFHAAAYKHVPMVERNPSEGVWNNILGTWHAAQAALACEVETFVLISTDKAVRPTNTMGTTKRFAELILQALAARYPDRTRFTMVRFGNVLGSSGSVVPLFREQIRRGGPITVTDPRIIRYFMTIPEAAQLVIQAGAMGKDGDVFVLDMGEPVKILDLARRMIHLSGLSVKDAETPDGDIEIVFTGLRPGEKMYEELLIGDNVVPTTHPRILRANEESLPLETVQQFIERFTDIHRRNATDELRAALLESVTGFAPQCGNEDLLAKE